MRQIETGIAPFAAAIDRKGSTAWVSNLGGRPPKPDELFASPMQKPAERVVVDSRGVASTGAVTRMDLETGKATHTLAVGLHPTALALDEAAPAAVRGQRQRRQRFRDRYGARAGGQDDRDPAVLADRARHRADGAAGLGGRRDVVCGMRRNQRGRRDRHRHGEDSRDDSHGLVSERAGARPGRQVPGGEFAAGTRFGLARCSFQTLRPRQSRIGGRVCSCPNAAQLASYTTAVAENNRLRLAGTAPENAREAARNAAPAAIPARSGEPSTIEHVVFIIKENRTYDQVLGDMAKGNGDPSLVMFGADVTPNQHRLAEQFVLLDNFYATGGNSADGHQWITQANETEYCLWPGYQGRSYPYDGSDPMAYSSGGFLWNYAQARGRSVRVYGEYAGRMSTPSSTRLDLLRKWEKGGDFTADWKIRAPIASLNAILAANYPAYSTSIPDVARAQIFLADLKRFESEGKLPNLMLVQLPSNHTFGTTPGVSTPKAMVADNDLAVGQIVEALSHSRFWPKMAIFIVEDDAQNGVDHVDGHRTTAFLASPYARRGHIDSTFYSHQSMLKTIELILGLPTMSIFDLIATRHAAVSFTDEPDLTPYTAVQSEAGSVRS